MLGLEIWDTLGQEKYGSLVSSYYKNTQGVMIVYDVTSMESFLNVKAWLIELEEHIAATHKNEAYILVGNKAEDNN